MPPDPAPIPLPTTPPAAAPPPSGFFALTRAHTAFSATLLLMLSSLLSGLLGLVRTKYIAHVFGAGHTTDAYLVAFNLPDMISYFLVGGVASITLVSILNRHREASGDEAADRTLSVVLVGMSVVLGSGVLLGELFAPLYIRSFTDLDPATAAIAIRLTRIILPGQLLLFIGSAVGSRLLVRKIFLYQAITPLLYNIGIILGGVLLGSRFGIDSLAYGVLAGALVGSTLLNLFGALRTGFRFSPILNLHHPAFVEWLKLSLPLMVGVSLVMADKWILSKFSTSTTGGYTHLNNAKTLFNAPLTVVGAAAGAASLPFFASLHAQGRAFDFNTAVATAVSRLVAAAFLLTAWMLAVADPLVDLYRGGSYSLADAHATAHYFVLFSLTLFLWSAQGIYARAFYAARNTLTPAISGTLVTLLSIPVYYLLFHHMGPAGGLTGLVIASDLGILTHTLTLAVLLHRARLVSLASLEYPELARALLAAAIAWAGASAALHLLPHPTTHTADLLLLLALTLVWATLSALTLHLTHSTLLHQLLRRRKP